ncbi:hypothetical protein QYF36_015758 [Acer negundo]|nr:hypothetical protein QYF36_015758 [Acer negundo]
MDVKKNDEAKEQVKWNSEENRNRKMTIMEKANAINSKQVENINYDKDALVWELTNEVIESHCCGQNFLVK